MAPASAVVMPSITLSASFAALCHLGAPLASIVLRLLDVGHAFPRFPRQSGQLKNACNVLRLHPGVGGLAWSSSHGSVCSYYYYES